MDVDVDVDVDGMGWPALLVACLVAGLLACLVAGLLACLLRGDDGCGRAKLFGSRSDGKRLLIRQLLGCGLGLLGWAAGGGSHTRAQQEQGGLGSVAVRFALLRGVLCFGGGASSSGWAGKRATEDWN
jgi:hypothetical protein